ncbi:DNA methyltransferase [Conexibacter sp. JD483]|uniref:DNA methyltransferase n=1 Tax=unclassified Conexibacter TaxID=2627773 RepID=UPI002718FE86|nr:MULTISPECIES: DNA methyltransferase [unclassified Conexibacter]MDO8185817.1 DNA methyltransferase [Conexibacter sp. CPCC 205706]MDO8198561.1 DNA methyltransferase [Conexibacter sp. CPCC 205762]MDR9367647.1 DNA methyltransferase [Conexibacter sp. JD483]
MLRTEADVLRTLSHGTYTLTDLYRLCGASVDISRDRGHDPPGPAHPTDTRWRHRVRCALQTLRAGDAARRVDRATWLLEGTPTRPRRLTLLIAGATPADFELRLADAVDLLNSVEEPVDLIVTDPPYGLRRDDPAAAARGYARDRTRTVPGYVDVDPGAYDAFTARWVAAAASALRMGGQLAAITGPQQAAAVQYHGQRSGLTWVNSIAAFRTFALRSTRRAAISHWTITVLARGALGHPARTFTPPSDLPLARSGADYPLDWWPENGRVARRGLLRYDNQLPLRLVLRIVEAFSRQADLVVDAFSGAGVVGDACLRLDRRFLGGDLNPEALRFTAARLLDEVLWPAERAPRLFGA